MGRFAHQLLVLTLTAFLSLGPSWRVAHASGIPDNAAAMDGVAGSCGDCQKCPTTGDQHTKAFWCGALCAMATQMVAPQVAPVVLKRTRLLFTPLEQPLRGRTSPPDPYPPKPSRAV